MENHGQKRSACEQLDLLEGVQVVLLDLLGIVTPTKFVRETLYSHLCENVKAYLEGNWENEECQQNVDALREQATKDGADGVEGAVKIPAKDENQEAIIAAVVANVEWLVKADRRNDILKELQGHVLREPFKTGTLQSQIYDDVSGALKGWAREGKKVYCFSAGSVESQKFILGYSNRGDLTKDIAGYFGLTVGSQTEKDSYTSIAKQIEASAEEILFLTAESAEATAAAEAGFKSCIVIREGNAPLTDDDKKKFNTVSSLRELTSPEEAPAKKQQAKTTEEEEKEDEDDDEEEEKEGEEKEDEGEEEEDEEGADDS